MGDGLMDAPKARLADVFFPARVEKELFHGPWKFGLVMGRGNAALTHLMARIVHQVQEITEVGDSCLILWFQVLSPFFSKSLGQTKGQGGLPGVVSPWIFTWYKGRLMSCASCRVHGMVQLEPNGPLG